MIVTSFRRVLSLKADDVATLLYSLLIVAVVGVRTGVWSAGGGDTDSRHVSVVVEIDGGGGG